MAETHVIEYELTEDMADSAADAVVAATGGSGVPARLRSLVLRLAVYGLGAAVIVAIGVKMGQPWWFFVAPAAMLVLGGVVAGVSAIVYVFGSGQRQYLGNTLREALRRLDSRRVRWTVTDDLLSVRSGNDVREIRWEDVTELCLTGTFWLLTARGSPTLLLSGDRVPDRTARFVLACAQRAGARIRVARGATDGEDRS